ncbi:MAG: A24 family peptidase [Pseudomonadota bacterium]|nr:A24 family peptidase [Pseudomonadota bacterium]
MMQEFDSLLELVLMLLKEPRTGILFGLLITASVSDYTTYKIPNWLTVSGILFGLIYNTLFPFSAQHGFLWALGGLLIGFFAMLPFYGLRIMGAGDVKLMAMVGAFLGITDTLYAVVFSFIAGGIGALVFALANQALARMLVNIKNISQVFILTAISGFKPEIHMETGASVGKLPYGICISIGSATYLITRQLGYF